MSSDERALLAAIDAAPADDLPRLVYADWLEEHGQEIRAEFIRVQCEIARLEASPELVRREFHAGLWARREELLSDHLRELYGPLGDLPDTAEVEFERGFPKRINLPVTDFLTHAATLDAVRPRLNVVVTGVAAKLPQFIEYPHLECVTHIQGYAAELDDGIPFTDVDQTAVWDASERLTRLEVLDLEGCGIGDWIGDVLSGCKFKSLVELDLSNNFITDAGIPAILAARLPKRLILGGNEITDDGAIELAEGLTRTDVENLNLRGTLIGRVGQIALLNTFNGQGKKVDLF